MDINSEDLRKQGKDLRKIAETFKQRQAALKQQNNPISPKSPAQAATRSPNIAPLKIEQRNQPPRLPGQGKLPPKLSSQGNNQSGPMLQKQRTVSSEGFAPPIDHSFTGTPMTPQQRPVNHSMRLRDMGMSPDTNEERTNLNQQRVLSDGQKVLSNEEYDDEEEFEEETEEVTDPDLHEFVIGRQRVVVRLENFSAARVVQGYLKKLCGEKSFLFSPSFEMRFCVLDLNKLVFRYAKSPKEQFSEILANELVSVEYFDKKKHKPIKIKNQSKNASDLRNVFFLHCKARSFVLSANTRTEQIMWCNGFEAFFKVKLAFEVQARSMGQRVNKFYSDLDEESKDTQTRSKSAFVDQRSRSNYNQPSMSDQFSPLSQDAPMNIQFEKPSLPQAKPKPSLSKQPQPLHDSSQRRPLAEFTIGGEPPKTAPHSQKPSTSLVKSPTISEAALRADLIDPKSPQSPPHEQSTELQRIMEMKRQQQKELEATKERLNLLNASSSKPLENAYAQPATKEVNQSEGQEETEGEWTYQTDQSIVSDSQEQRPGPTTVPFSESEYAIPSQAQQEMQPQVRKPQVIQPPPREIVNTAASVEPSSLQLIEKEKTRFEMPQQLNHGPEQPIHIKLDKKISIQTPVYQQNDVAYPTASYQAPSIVYGQSVSRPKLDAFALKIPSPKQLFGSKAPKISPQRPVETKLGDTPNATKAKLQQDQVVDLLASLQTIPVDDDEPEVQHHSETSFEGQLEGEPGQSEVLEGQPLEPVEEQCIIPQVKEAEVGQAFRDDQLPQERRMQEVEQTEVCTFVEELKTIDHPRADSSPRPPPYPPANVSPKPPEPSQPAHLSQQASHAVQQQRQSETEVSYYSTEEEDEEEYSEAENQLPQQIHDEPQRAHIEAAPVLDYGMQEIPPSYKAPAPQAGSQKTVQLAAVSYSGEYEQPTEQIQLKSIPKQEQNKVPRVSLPVQSEKPKLQQKSKQQVQNLGTIVFQPPTQKKPQPRQQEGQMSQATGKQHNQKDRKAKPPQSTAEKRYSTAPKQRVQEQEPFHELTENHQQSKQSEDGTVITNPEPQVRQKIRKIHDNNLKLASQRQVSRHRRFNIVRQSNPQEKSLTNIMGQPMTEYSSQRYARPELAESANSQQQSLQSSVNQDTKPENKAKLFSKEFLKTRELMKIKRTQGNTRQLNLLQSSYASNRSNNSKSPVHGFRADKYRNSYGTKVSFKRNVSVTQVFPKDGESKGINLLNNAYRSESSYFDHTSAVQAIIAGLNNKKKEEVSSQGSFRLNVTYDIIAPSAEQTQSVRLGTAPLTTQEKKNQRMLQMSSKKAAMNASESGLPTDSVVSLKGLFHGEATQQEITPAKPRPVLEDTAPVRAADRDTIECVSPTNPLITPNKNEDSAASKHNSLQATGTFKPPILKQDSFSLATQSNFTDTPNNQSKTKERSNSRTSDIFKRSIEHNSISHHDTVAREIQFDQLINNQRDALFLDKVEKQSKIAAHRRNSETRKSLEADRQSEINEKRRLRREQRKQLRENFVANDLQTCAIEHDPWDGPIKPKQSAVPTTASLMKQAETKMRETFDDSESSKYQTLDEHEKIKKLNAWIEKQKVYESDFLNTQHLKAHLGSNLAMSQFRSNLELQQPLGASQSNIDNAELQPSLRNYNQRRAEPPKVNSSIFYKPQEEAANEEKQDQSFEDEW